ncbi:MAG: (2Fe-2S)-binding protein [Planctomycetota bacterium]|jgi:aerobic-type carbon monoxide dehydrogenase small subunit (CoxS/CutS family)
MPERKKPDAFSRRSFVKGIGAGVVGGYALVQSKEAEAQEKAAPREVAEHEGKAPLSLEVNGKTVRVLVDSDTTLAEVLRSELKLTGTKVGCNHAECGSCTVLLDNKAVYSCHMLALDAAGRSVTTIEGLLTGEKLHPIQEAFLEHDGFQCGFCTSGQIMSAQALLMKNPAPGTEEVLQGMSGNICRCAAYPNIIDSVVAAAEKVRNR